MVYLFGVNLTQVAQFLLAGCPSCCPTNSTKAVKIQKTFNHSGKTSVLVTDGF